MEQAGQGDFLLVPAAQFADGLGRVAIPRLEPAEHLAGGGRSRAVVEEAGCRVRLEPRISHVVRERLVEGQSLALAVLAQQAHALADPSPRVRRARDLMNRYLAG